MNIWQKHRQDLDTICRILSVVIAGITLVVTVKTLQIRLEEKSQSEVPVPTKTQCN